MSGFNVTARDVLDLQNAIQSVGQEVTYFEAGGGAGRTLKARVRYFNAVELANAIEAYPIEVTLDSRDFAGRAPLKGDAIRIDGARCGVMQVRPRTASGYLISYQCGVQG
jgi:hypothetical protein